MVIRCSLLGHDYGESEVEREREERGSEVVVTLREIQECERCGSTTVVSENKEVTSLEPPEPEPDPAGTGSVSGVADGLAERNAADRPGTAVGDEAAERAGTEFVDDDGFEDAMPQDPETDDGVILDEDDADEEPAERQYGQWPEPEERPAAADEGESGGEGPRAWPEVDGEDEGFDAGTVDDEVASVSFSGGLTPEAAEETATDDDAEFIEAVDSDAQFSAQTPTDDELAGEGGHAHPADSPSGITSAPSTPGEPSSDDPGVFVCPRCDFVRDAAGSSLRAGDICPDCRRGYLAEQDA